MKIYNFRIIQSWKSRFEFEGVSQFYENRGDIFKRFDQEGILF